MIVIEETDQRYYLAESTLQNAGYGLFAKVPLKKGDYLEVMGVLVKKGGIADTCTHYAKRYKFAAETPEFKIVPMGHAGIVNHTDDTSKQNCELQCLIGANCRSPHASGVVYYFTKDIGVGEELLGNYGAQIGEEVDKMAQSTAYHKENLSQWDGFLTHNLYDMKRLCEML